MNYAGKTKEHLMGKLSELNSRIAAMEASDERQMHVEEELKKTKDYLDKIIESSLDGVAVSDHRGYITRVNKAFLKLIDFEEEEVVGKHIAEFTPYEKGIYKSTTGELVELTGKFIYDAMKMIEKLFNEGSISNWESYYLRRDKKVIPVEMNIAYLYNDEGDIIGSVGINRDITKRRQVEKALSEAHQELEAKVENRTADLKRHQQMLQASEKSLKEFSRKILSVREEEMKKLSRSLHDEVGSMSVSLGSCLSIAAEEIKDHNLRDALEMVGQTKSLLAQSVEKLKKMSADLRPPDLDVVGLPGVLREYISNMRKQVQVKLEFSENVNEKHINDEIAIVLYRITQEALTNSIKHAQAKKVKVSLDFSGDNTALTVSDDGKGFDVEKRLHQTKGLGMRGMRERTESLGGTFVVSSVAQKGTTVSITIPT